MITVSIVYAETRQQWLQDIKVRRGTNARELIEQSELLTNVAALANTNIAELIIGTFGQKIELDYLLEDGDRVEIYRALRADPKEVRRQLARLAKNRDDQ